VTACVHLDDNPFIFERPHLGQGRGKIVHAIVAPSREYLGPIHVQVGGTRCRINLGIAFADARRCVEINREKDA
jgi:hypothetical protein